jgi:hypothetical protein
VTLHRRVATAAALAVTGLLGLSGCGSDLGPELHPGVAAIVGDETISIDQVDEKAVELCDFGVASGQVTGGLAMGSLRANYLQTVIDHELAREFLEEKGALEDPGVRQQLRVAKQQVAAQAERVEPEVRDIFVELGTMSSYISTVQQLAGEEFAAFVQEAEVIRDPRFPEQAAPGQAAGSNALSVPVSDLARAAADPRTQEEYDAYVASLPASQKCGA